MLDLVLLRVLSDKAEYARLRPMLAQLDSTILSSDTLEIVKDYDRYYQQYDGHDRVDPATILTRLQVWHSTLSKEQLQARTLILNNVLKRTADEDQIKNMRRELAEHEMVQGMKSASEQFQLGDMSDLLSTVEGLRDRFHSRLDVRALHYIDTDIGELLKREEDNTGVKWPLACLNDSMRPLRAGDFLIAAGRPDRGKTSFIAYCAAHFANQLPEDQNILWLNNEGPGERIKPRLYQAATGFSIQEMIDEHAKGLLVPAYVRAVGRTDRIRIFDIHGFTTGQVELILQDNNPGIIIYDMMDNIAGVADAGRQDLNVEAKYQWARERCVKYNAIGIATSQVSAEGDGELYPSMAALKDSKTGKQGACDVILMIGCSNDPGLQSIRGISLPKNKLHRAGGAKDPRTNVQFDGLRCRFEDIPMEGLN